MIIDKIASPFYKKRLQDIFNSSDFPWYYADVTQMYKIDPNKSDNLFQFCHIFINDGKSYSNLTSEILPLIYAFEKETGLKVKETHRIKANLLTRMDFTDDDLYLTIHKDVGIKDFNDESDINTFKNYVSFIYYVNDSDGDTVLFDNETLKQTERINPISGNCVWFKSTTPHRATPPKEHKNRIVINFVLELDND
jgi:hypothetical protein